MDLEVAKLELGVDLMPITRDFWALEQNNRFRKVVWLTILEGRLTKYHYKKTNRLGSANRGTT